MFRHGIRTLTFRPDQTKTITIDKTMKDFLPRNPPSLYPCGCGINRHKKSPPCGYWHEGLHPAFLALSIHYRNPSIGGSTAFTKAGFLALGSFYSLRLPVSFYLETVAMQISSPITAAGPLPILTEFPIKPFRAPLIESHIQADRFCQMLKTISSNGRSIHDCRGPSTHQVPGGMHRPHRPQRAAIRHHPVPFSARTAPNALNVLSHTAVAP